MEFSKEHLVKIKTMTGEEAKIFILFLETEIQRHEMDIDDAYKLIDKVKMMFGGKVE